MSNDVRQWLDYRYYHKRPPLRSYFGYVIVPFELLNNDFYTFKERLPENESCFQYSKIIEFWSKAEQHNVLDAEMFGKKYQKIYEYEAIDALALWMKKARAAHTIHGTDIFRYSNYILLKKNCTNLQLFIGILNL